MTEDRVTRSDGGVDLHPEDEEHLPPTSANHLPKDTHSEGRNAKCGSDSSPQEKHQPQSHEKQHTSTATEPSGSEPSAGSQEPNGSQEETQSKEEKQQFSQETTGNSEEDQCKTNSANEDEETKNIDVVLGAESSSEEKNHRETSKGKDSNLPSAEVKAEEKPQNKPHEDSVGEDEITKDGAPGKKKV